MPAAAGPSSPMTATARWWSAAATGCSSPAAADPSGPAEGCADGRRLVGLYLLVVLVGGTTTLVGVLLGRRLRARWDQRHPERAAARQRARYQRRVAAEWPLLAKTLGLGYTDVWSRQHAYPSARFVVDDQGVTATVAAIAGAGLADYQHAVTYLA